MSILARLRPHSPRRSGILFLAGANLFIVQFLAVRTVPGILVGTEMILFLVVFSYFLGISAGYWAADRISGRWLGILGVAQFLTHLTLPFSLRFLSAYLMDKGMDRVELLSILGLGAFWVSAFYSILLPRFMAELPAERDGEFSRLYGTEVLGGIVGSVLILTVPRLGPGVLEILYQAMFAVLLALLLDSRRVFAVGGVACALYAAALRPMEGQSVAALFQARERPARRILYSGNTAYQRVEIIEDIAGGRHLYLDGFRHFGSADLTDFNFFVAGLPAALMTKPEIVIVGSGSFWAVKKALKSGGRVTSVELDPVVAERGRTWLAPEFTPGELKRWTVLIDDAKHHFGGVPEPADLVAMDVAGPFQRQVALLFTREFYALVRSRLREGGVLSTPLNGHLARGDVVSCRTASTLGAVFKQYLVLERPDHETDFILAGDHLPFSKEQVRELLLSSGKGGSRVLDRAEAESQAYKSCSTLEPISWDNMDFLWRSGIRRLRRDLL